MQSPSFLALRVLLAEGNLSRRGRVCLVQLHAAGRTFVFDLVAVLLAEYADVLGLLRGLLEDRSVVKVSCCRRLEGGAGPSVPRWRAARQGVEACGAGVQQGGGGELSAAAKPRQPLWRARPCHTLVVTLAAGCHPPMQVMHDCRRDCEALLYQHGIRVQGVWDTQVGRAGLNTAVAVEG